MKTRTARLVSSATVLAAIGLAPVVLANQGCSSASEEDVTASNQQLNHQAPIRVMKMRDPSSAKGVQPDSAPAGAKLVYNGARVVSNMEVVVVYYGTGSYLPQLQSSAAPNIASFYQGVLNSPYVDWFDGEYNTVTHSSGGTKTNQHIGRGSVKGTYTIKPSSANGGSTVDDSNIQAELAAQIAAGKLPAPTSDSAGNNNTYYALFFPNGTTVTMGGSSSCVAGGFCAYHGSTQAGLSEVYYGVHPDMQAGSGCDTGCGNSTKPFNNYTSVASHEMSETITDCEVGAGNLAWYDQTNGEIGDICNAQQGSVVGSDGLTYTVQQEFSNAMKNCIVSKGTTPPPPDAGPPPPPPDAGSSSAIVNGGFEDGNFTGWSTSGASETVVSSGCHSGSHCAMAGKTTASKGSSSIAQTFTVPAGKSQISLWYNEDCPGSVSTEWATAQLTDDTAGTSHKILVKTCDVSGWKNVTRSVTSGHSYTLTLSSHDDNSPSDPAYALYDDVTLN